MGKEYEETKTTTNIYMYNKQAHKNAYQLSEKYKSKQ